MWAKEYYQNSLVQPMRHEAQEESGNNLDAFLERASSVCPAEQKKAESCGEMASGVRA